MPRHHHDMIRSVDTMPKADFTWEGQAYTLEDIVHKFQLPRVVQCTHKMDDAASRGTMDLLQPLLLYESRTCRKIIASSLDMDDRTSRLTELGDPLLIPEDYKGWFAVLGPETRIRTAPHYTTISQLSLADCDTFLIGGTDKVQAVLMLKKTAYPETRDLYPGDVLRMGSVFSAKIKVKSSRFRSQTREEKFLMCTDQTDREVLLPLHAEGMFYIVKHRSTPPKVPILQIRDIMSKMKNSCVVKLVFGRVPSTPCPFTGMMCFKEVYSETSIVSSSIVNLRNILMEMPADIPLTFKLAVPNHALLNYPGYLDALAMCRDKSDSFVRNIKVTQGPLPDSPSKDLFTRINQPHIQSKNNDPSINLESKQSRDRRSNAVPVPKSPTHISQQDFVSRPTTNVAKAPRRPWETSREEHPKHEETKIPPQTPHKPYNKNKNRSTPNLSDDSSDRPPNLPPRHSLEDLTAVAPNFFGLPSPTRTTQVTRVVSHIQPVQPSFRLPPPPINKLNHVDHDLPLPSPPISPENSFVRLPPTPEENSLSSSQNNIPYPTPPSSPRSVAPPNPPLQSQKPDQLDRLVAIQQAPPPMRPPSQLQSHQLIQDDVDAFYGNVWDTKPQTKLTRTKSINVSIGDKYLMLPVTQDQPEQNQRDGNDRSQADRMNFWKQIEQVNKLAGAVAPKHDRLPNRKHDFNFSEKRRNRSSAIEILENDMIYQNFEFLEKSEYSGCTDAVYVDTANEINKYPKPPRCPNRPDTRAVDAQYIGDTRQSGNEESIYHTPDYIDVDPSNVPELINNSSVPERDEPADAGLIGMTVDDVYEFLSVSNVKQKSRDLLKQGLVDGRMLNNIEEDEFSEMFPSIGLIDKRKIYMFISGFKIRQGKQT